MPVLGDTRYKDDFHPKSLLELSSQGKCVVQVCAEWSICRDTFYEWLKINPLLSDTFKICKEKSIAWWFNSGQENINNKKYNTTLWSMMVQTMGVSTKERLIQVEALADDENKSLADMARGLIKAVGKGELNSKETANLITAIGTISKIDETDELRKKVEELETMMNKKQ